MTSSRKFIIFAGFVGVSVFLAVAIGIPYMQRQATYYSSSLSSYSSGIAEGPIVISPSYVKDSNSGVTNTLSTNANSRSITKNYLSAHIKDTAQFLIDLKKSVADSSGKIMDEYVSDSSESSSVNGTLSVLIPNDRVSSFLEFVGQKSIKIVNKQVTSYQISEQYTDIERRLVQLELTYSRLQKIYDKATSVEEILKVQKEMTTVQTEIDQLKGQKSSLELLSDNTQITVYFSTNELSLPYVPEGTFEFEKTFRLAIRNMVQTVDGVLKGSIYLVVFLPIIAVLALVAFVGMKVYRRLQK